jgi:hypothetical protein
MDENLKKMFLKVKYYIEKWTKKVFYTLQTARYDTAM